MENNNTTQFEKVFNILESTGTNWTAEKKQLISIDGNATESFGVFRSDDGQWLGTVKDRYKPMQNATLVELLVEAAGTLDLNLTSGGIFKNGSRVFYQLGLSDEYIGKSFVKRNITALNSHDGSTSIAFGSSNTVVACSNSFFRVHREKGNMEKVKHTISAHERVREMAYNIRFAIENDVKMMETFKRMADVQLRDEMVEKLVSKLFKVDVNKDTKDVGTRTKNNIITFADNLQTEINLEGRTIWGLFNAVTRYTNHHAAPKNDLAKSEYLMLGTGADLSNLAFNELAAYIENNSTQYVIA